MITLKLHNYTPDQKRALLTILSESLMNVNDECDSDCDNCSIKVVCEDLSRATRYLNTVCTSKK